MTVEEPKDSLDKILVKLNDFGRYQIWVFFLVCLAVALHSAVHVAYVFTALDVNYRCRIPGCDSLDSPTYETSWIKEAVPFMDKNPVRCEKYVPYNNETFTANCSSQNFNREVTESCSDFVFETSEQSIVQEYNLYCDDNLWKITMVGTINNIGQFFGLFVTGILSDKFGRRAVLIWGLVSCALAGIIRAFMPTYELFLVFEFLDAALGSGTYICGFVLGVELVGPKNRVLTGTMASSSYAIGEIFTSTSAWLVQSWKPLIFIIYPPMLFTIFYYWMVPESIRWNLSKGKIEEAKVTLRTLAKVNNKEISERELEKLAEIAKETQEAERSKGTFKQGLKSVTLLIRLANCCFCWITCTFLFFGLSLNSVALAGNSYLDFTLSALVEIPAYISCNYTIEKWGRKRSLMASYLLTAVACIGFVFMPENLQWGSLAIYLIGKFGATAAFTSLYVLTSEMFPTTMRHSFMGTCSTFGRIGSMIAPQTPLLAKIWNPLPLISFGLMACVAAAITMIFPETIDIRLPDTVAEAEMIGSKEKVSVQAKL